MLRCTTLPHQVAWHWLLALQEIAVRVRAQPQLRCRRELVQAHLGHVAAEELQGAVLREQADLLVVGPVELLAEVEVVGVVRGRTTCGED